MWRNLKVNLTDLVFSVSEAMDLSDPSLVDHQVRTGFVCMCLARAAEIDYATTERLFLAALMHDIGALSPEEKIGAHVFEDQLPEVHCQRGAKLFREAFWLAPAANIVQWHHTPMSCHLAAGRSINDVDVLASQILFLADHLERAINRSVFILHQQDELQRRICSLAPEALHPDVLELFAEVSAQESFWLELVAKDLNGRLRERNPLRSIEVDFLTARSIAAVFKDMTDFRSRFTATHSAGVACCARGIAEKLLFSGKDLQQIELAGLLHDIGKLVVPNAILCKPGALTSAEYAVMRQHPFYTHRILSRVRGFEQIAEWAAFHHERLDGSGYADHLGREALDLGAKVIAVADVATALAERRPYRESGGRDRVTAVLREMSDKRQVEPDVVNVLLDHYEEIMGSAAAVQAADELRYAERYAALD